MKYHGFELAVIDQQIGSLLALLEANRGLIANLYYKPTYIRTALCSAETLHKALFKEPPTSVAQFCEELSESQLLATFTAFEPAICRLADREFENSSTANDYPINHLYASAARWGAFEGHENMDVDQAEALAIAWKRYEVMGGHSAALRSQRLFSHYSLAQPEKITTAFVIGKNHEDEFKRISGGYNLKQMLTPEITYLIAKSMMDSGLQESDDVRRMGAVEVADKTVIAVYATEPGIRQLASSMSELLPSREKLEFRKIPVSWFEAQIVH